MYLFQNLHWDDLNCPNLSGDPVTSPILYHLTPMSSVSYLPILPMLDGCLKIISQKQHIEIS